MLALFYVYGLSKIIRAKCSPTGLIFTQVKTFVNKV